MSPHLFLVPILVAIVDFSLKLAALNALTEHERVFNFFFDISLYKNPGIAGSIFIPHAILLPISTIIIALLIYGMRKTAMPMHKFAFLCILSGALGNYIDRIIHGFTTDYILIVGQSVINLADILIIVGIAILILYNKK